MKLHDSSGDVSSSARKPRFRLSERETSASSLHSRFCARRINRLKPLNHYKPFDLVLVIGATVGVVLFFTGHHHNGGPGITPVAAHDCSRNQSSSFLQAALAHEDGTSQFSQPPPPTALIHNNHLVQVTIDDTGFSPKDIAARLCNILVITNTGKHTHQPAVGPHPYHTAYPGLEAKNPLKSGEKFEFLLTRPGSYPLHDHLQEQVRATITISEN